MQTVVRDIHSSDGECFDEQDNRGFSPGRSRNQVSTVRRQQSNSAIVAVPTYTQNGQISSDWGNGEDDNNQIIDEQMLEAKLNAITQAHLAYSQQALKSVKDACMEAIRQKESTISQLQLENQRLQQNSRQWSGGGHNSGGTGESPPTQGYSSPIKKPQVAWNTDDSSNNLRDAGKPDVRSSPPAPVSAVVVHPRDPAPKLQQAPSLQLARTNTNLVLDNRPSQSSEKIVPSRADTRRVSVAATAKKARLDAKEKGTSEEGQRAIQDGGQGVFIDAAAMKERVKEAIMRPEYNVMNYYKKDGCWQFIARNPLFENFTLCVIAFNALWIAIDTDRNKAATLIVAHPVFIVAENTFCIYFTGELAIRFFSFQKKRDCLRDAWFMFDSCLVIMMVLETWVMSIILIVTNKGGGAGLGDASILRLVRLLRLTRMARMARLLRAFPELMILVKGISVATRSVFFTLCLLAIIIYVFGVAFTQLSENTQLEDLYFATVPDAMNSLLLRGVLPDLSDFVNNVGRENIFLSVILLFFILLSSLTVMNMLVGVLVEVVSVVSSVEKEQMTVQFVKNMILSMLQNSGLDADHNYHISRLEFESLLLKPEAARIIQEVGVDVVGLVDFADFIFKDDVELSFPELMEIVLQLRGCNTATVRDIVDLRKFVLTEIHTAVENISVTVSEKVEESVMVLQMQSASNQISNDISNNNESGAAREIYSAATDTSGKRPRFFNPNPPGSAQSTPSGSRANTRGNQGGRSDRRAGGLTCLGLHRPYTGPSNSQPLPEFPEHMWMTEMEHEDDGDDHPQGNLPSNQPKSAMRNARIFNHYK